MQNTNLQSFLTIFFSIKISNKTLSKKGLFGKRLSKIACEYSKRGSMGERELKK